MTDVAVHNAHPERRVSPVPVRNLVRGVLRSEGVRRAAISVVFTDDRLCRRVNRRFLAHDRPTDVISFPLEDPPNLEGEIYVNLDKAARQARTYRVTWANEIARLVIHGTLHLVGYDDRKVGDARRMKERENRYVGLLAGKGTRPR